MAILFGALQLGAETPGEQLQRLIANAKPNPHALVSARYLGGSGYDQPTAIAVDSEGFAYVAGVTDSDDFPTTPGTLQPTYNAPCQRRTPDSTCQFFGFLTKLAPDGKTIVFSTYLGNPDGQAMYAHQIAVGVDGAIYLAGTARGSLPAAPGSYQPTCKSPIACVFVAKLDPEGKRLEYATYLSGSVSDFAISLKVDGLGRAWVSGATNSEDFPKSPAAFQSRIGGGYNDGFIAVLSADGTTLEYSTLLGGTGSEGVVLVRFLSDEAVVFSGGSDSVDFPVTDDARQKKLGGRNDVIYGALDIKRGLTYSTYFGDERANDGTILPVESAYLLQSRSFPSRTNPADANGFSSDVLIADLSDLQMPSTPIIDVGFTGSYRLSVYGVSGTQLYLNLTHEVGYPNPPHHYQAGWDRNRQRWAYVYSGDLPAGYGTINSGSALHHPSRRLWTAVELTQGSAPFDRIPEARPGRRDALILLEDLSERKVRWNEQTVQILELRSNQSLDISSQLFPEGTGHRPQVEISCTTPSAELSCQVEPTEMILEGQAEVRVRIERRSSALVPAAAVFFAIPLGCALCPRTRSRRLTVLVAMVLVSLTLSSCTGLLRHSTVVRVTAHTAEHSVSTEFQVDLAQ